MNPKGGVYKANNEGSYNEANRICNWREKWTTEINGEKLQTIRKFDYKRRRRNDY